MSLQVKRNQALFRHVSLRLILYLSVARLRISSNIFFDFFFVFIILSSRWPVFSFYIFWVPSRPNPCTLFHFGFGDPSASHLFLFSSVLLFRNRTISREVLWASPYQIIMESDCASQSVVCAERAPHLPGWLSIVLLLEDVALPSVLSCGVLYPGVVSLTCSTSP